MSKNIYLVPKQSIVVTVKNHQITHMFALAQRFIEEENQPKESTRGRYLTTKIDLDRAMYDWFYSAARNSNGNDRIWKAALGPIVQDFITTLQSEDLKLDMTHEKMYAILQNITETWATNVWQRDQEVFVNNVFSPFVWNLVNGFYEIRNPNSVMPEQCRNQYYTRVQTSQNVSENAPIVKHLFEDTDIDWFTKKPSEA